MAKKKTTKAKNFFGETIEGRVVDMVVSEYETSKSNNSTDIADYESVVDMLECRRTEKNYEWMSDVFIPELPSIFLTDAGGWANQYFQSRDFVEVRLESDESDGMAKCRAAKNAINKTLNIREIYHYPKYIRGRTINSAAGVVYAVEWWDRRTAKEQVGVNVTYQPSPENEDVLMKIETPVFRDKLLNDHYNYEIVDPSNVFTDNSYVYNVQDKPYVIIRSEKTIEELEENKARNKYINLELIRELIKTSGETETSRESYNKDENKQTAKETPQKRFDYIERYGKDWVVVTRRADDDGFPIECEPGFDEEGNKKDDAEFIEMIIGTAFVGSAKILTRFQPQFCRNPYGDAYKPILRGVCYIHPRKDTGLSDGKYLREPQIAINDAYNLSADRTTLATLPTLIGRRNAVVDNDTLYFEPEHIMEVENPKEDLIDMKIQDNIEGSLQLQAMLTNKMQQVSSVFPSTMGDLPVKASTTATAISGAESRANLRSNYKSLTYEYTFLVDQYTHILWMIYQFAMEETAIKLLGKDLEVFDPNADYTFTPLTSQIETEHGKANKLKVYDQILGRIVAMQHPDTIKIVNYILQRTFELMGDEFSAFKNIMPDTGVPIQSGTGEQQSASNLMPMSNQSEMPQSSGEQMARGQFKGQR